MIISVLTCFINIVTPAIEVPSFELCFCVVMLEHILLSEGLGGGLHLHFCKTDSYNDVGELITPVPLENDCFQNKLAYL